MEPQILNIVSEKIDLENLKKEAIQLTREYFASELLKFKSKFNDLAIIEFERFELLIENQFGVSGVGTRIGVFRKNENFIKNLEPIGSLITIYDFEGNYIDEYGSFDLSIF